MITRKRVLQALESLGADSKVWVAGSAAIIPELANDIDIWILKKSPLHLIPWNETIWSPIGESDAYPQNIPYVVKRLETTVPGVEGFSDPIKLQLMFTEAKQIWDLLEYFDVSCHAWARNKDGYLVAHPKATLPGSPIVNLGGIPDCDCSPECKNLSNLIIKRIEEFTLRYADTTPSMCWLPS